MNKLLFGLLAFSLSTQVFSIPYKDMSDKAIAKRIQPVGSVFITDTEEMTSLDSQTRIAITSHHEAPQHQNGKQVYENYCYICHQQGVAGAPMFGNAHDWQPRAQKGIATLMKHALDGYRYMPPRGTCLECSDDEIKQAVTYMVAESTK